jgi:oxaloacetate decarboxylase alpha subunit
MKPIKLVDVSVRDGNQSLWSMTGLDSAQMLGAAPLMERAGFKAIDFTSSTHMAVGVRYHRDDPWERIRLMRRALPTIPLQFISTGFRFISWETADHDFMRLAYRKLQEAGIGRFVLLDPMHDMEAIIQVARIVKAEGAAENMLALTYTLSDVHTDAFYANCARQAVASGYFDLVYIKDPSGLLTPERARTLIPAVKAAIGAMPLELHSHCTIGLSQFNYMVGAELGIDALHTAIGPLAHGSSLPCASQTIANLRTHGYEVDINERAIRKLEEYFFTHARAEGLPIGQPQAYDAAFLRHQIAGGVLTTTRRQLAELKLEHRFVEVMAEAEIVRYELGSPIMVTPFPQIVATQALFNVTGSERYGNIPDQVIRYVLGRFGRPTAPVDPKVLDRIMAMPRTREIEREPATMTLKDKRKQFPAGMSDEEFLLRAVMPGDQIDAMQRNTQLGYYYNPALQPVLKLLQEIKQRPKVTQLQIRKEGFTLSLASNSGNRKEGST